MKKFILAVIILFSGFYSSEAQECKVLKKGIDQKYSGDCKRGKAHGEGIAEGSDTYSGDFKKGLPEGYGIYTWKNGDVYEGEWDNGEMDGKGKFTHHEGTVEIGYWKKGEYSGQYEEPFEEIDKSQNVSSYSIVQRDREDQSIRLYLKEDQNSVRNPTANVVMHHGNYTTLVNSFDFIELEDVIFPFKAKVYFGGQFIEFEIFNKGSWDVTTNITNIKGLEN